MSNRRKPRQDRRRRTTHDSVVQPAPESGLPMSGFEPWLWAIQDADEAELRGDAAGALEAMERRWLDPEGHPFWRPSRAHGLGQLIMLASYLPAWARSRWVLTQALHHLHEDDRDAAAARSARALQVAVDLRGGLTTVEGRDETDKAVSVADHDWVYRQMHLYELGGLDAFLRQGATPDLLAGCDRIEEWAQAPMGGYLYLCAVGDTLLWTDLSRREIVRTVNIGSAVRLVAGAAVIGRVVPVEGGLLFEGPPLEVGYSIADAVAQDPSAWLDILHRAAGRIRDGEIVTHHREWRSLLSDVPFGQLRRLLFLRSAPAEVAPESIGVELARATLDLARSELDHDALVDAGRREKDDEWDGWAHVHAALLDPMVIEALPDVVGPEDVELLEDICAQVAEPAFSWLAGVIDRVRMAA